MPTITSTFHHWSAREVLYARCPYCAFILNWVNDQKSDGLVRAASCCNLAFYCEVDTDNPPWFNLTTHEIDMTNVVMMER